MTSDDEQHDRVRHPRQQRVLIAAALLVVAGFIALAVGLHAQQQAPQPPLSAATPPSGLSPTSSASGGPVATGKPRGLVLPAAKPISLSVPSIGVDGSLLQLGLNSDNTVQVPPQTKKAHAGWFRGSPTPGQLGPAIILGHVDSAKYGPGVFFKLGALRPGAGIDVTRSDHTVAVFRVERVVAYPKNAFPSFDVYGNTDNAALRLITCGGKFNISAHSYESNIVAYASLISSHHT